MSTLACLPGKLPSSIPPCASLPGQTVFLHCDGTDTVEQMKGKLQELLQKVGRVCCGLWLHRRGGGSAMHTAQRTAETCDWPARGTLLPCEQVQPK